MSCRTKQHGCQHHGTDRSDHGNRSDTDQRHQAGRHEVEVRHTADVAGALVDQTAQPDADGSQEQHRDYEGCRNRRGDSCWPTEDGGSSRIEEPRDVQTTDEQYCGLFLTRDQKMWAGGVLLNLKGEVVGRLPGGSAGGAHAVAVSGSGDVYLAQLSGRVQKFILQ